MGETTLLSRLTRPVARSKLSREWEGIGSQPDGDKPPTTIIERNTSNMAHGKPLDHRGDFHAMIATAMADARATGLAPVRFTIESFPVYISETWDWDDGKIIKAATTIRDEALTDLVMDKANATDHERDVFGPVVPSAIRAYLMNMAEEHKRLGSELQKAARLMVERKRTGRNPPQYVRTYIQSLRDKSSLVAGDNHHDLEI